MSRTVLARAPDVVQPVRPEDMTKLACLRYNAGLRQRGVPEASGRYLDCSRSPAK